MKKRIAVAVALLVVAGAGVAAAHGKRRGPEERAERIVERVTRELDLDTGQREQFGRLVAEFLPVAQQLRTVRRQTRTRIADQLRAGTFDTGALKSATHENLATLESSADLFIERLAEFHARLTPEQRQKVAGRLERLDDAPGRDGREGNEGRGGRPRHGRQRDQR